MISTTVKLSATGALTLILSMASGWVVVSLLHWPPLQTLGSLLCVGVLGSVAIHTMVSRRLKELSVVGAELNDLAVASAQQSRHQRDQNSLDRNLNLLRRILAGYGEPALRNGRLYFGNRCINGDFEAVDRVKADMGGTATIFMADERVATNVMTPDGARAIGTTLAQGPARDSALSGGKLFRGEAEIFGAPHFTIYEPIVSDGKTIGILYVGVRKSIDTATLTASGSTDDLVGMLEKIAVTRKTMLAQAEQSQEAILQRQATDDSRRHDDIGRQTAAAEQRYVVAMLADGLENLAKGNLVFRLERPFSSDYEKLRTDFNLAMQTLREAIRIVVSTADGIRSGAAEITSAADDLANRTEHQAASLEQTVVALDQITATVKKTADGAGHARDVVSSAHGNTQRMRTIVDSAIAAMGRIDKSSEQISQIIGMIDEIAFQTNLLALNAGVEAARAGESGRGFAVVASEVRALAQRSASAAKQIKTLISVSVGEVQQGVAFVGETGTSLEHTMKQVREIDEIVTEIAASAREQANGLNEVNTAINQMDQVTQKNAAMVEQSTAASHGLAQDIKHLAELVAKFQVEEDGGVRKADRSSERTSLSVMAGGRLAH